MRSCTYCKYTTIHPVQSDQGYYYIHKNGKYKQDDHGCYVLEYRLSPTEPWPYVMKTDYIRPLTSDNDWKKHTPFPTVQLKLVKKANTLPRII
jgi:hypothetical protein